ncbi:FHA domain-containing protein [Chloroflexota bacterium]
MAEFKQATKKILSFILLFSLLPVFNGGIFKGTTYQGSDPWESAVIDAQARIQTYGDLPGNFLAYADQAQAINQHLSEVKRSQPLLDQIDKLKNFPLLGGNAWDLVIQAMNGSYPGSGDALRELDFLLRKMISQSAALDDLNMVNGFIVALNDFGSNPSRSTLVALNASGRDTVAFLSPVKSHLSEINGMASELLGSMDAVRSGLNFGGDLTNNSIISDFVFIADSVISNLSAPVGDLASQSLGLADQIGQDMQVMQDIQDIVYDAEYAPSSPELPSTLPGVVQDTNWLYFVSAAVVVVGFGILMTMIVARYSKRKRPKEVFEEGLPIGETPQYHAFLKTEGGLFFPLEGNSLNLGRAADCEIRIPDDAISSHHAVLRFSGENWFIQDANSSTGLFVNGQRIQTIKLQNGDKVGIGRTILTFRDG